MRHSPIPAPWLASFVENLQQMKMASFVLSTVDNASDANGPRSVPYSRTVIFRGFWASLPENSRNTAPKNPDVWDSDLLTITTDARMKKTHQLFSSSPDTNQDSSTFKGGAVEAVFWAEQANTQWRLRGHTFVLGPNVDTERGGDVREAISCYMREKEETGDFSFSKELTAHFGNLSPGMRGSFRNPPPGTPRSKSPGPGLGLGQVVDDLHDSIARENFRVVIIVPEEVDKVDLSDPGDHRRWNYKLEGGEWKTEELWP